MTRVKWNAHKIEILRNLFANRVQISGIAKYFRRGEPAVKCALERYGVPRRDGKTRQTRHLIKPPTPPKRTVVMVPRLETPKPKLSVLESAFPWPSRRQLMARRA